MTLDPLFSAPIAIQLHVATVIPAAFLGAYILTARKGTPRHRLLGKVWIVLMVLSALSSFFIHTIRVWGDFSPIHLLSIWVLFASGMAIYTARKKQIKTHRGFVSGMYLGGIVGAGLFTFFPGRIMNEMFLGGYNFVSMPSVATAVAAILIAALFVLAARVVVRARA